MSTPSSRWLTGWLNEGGPAFAIVCSLADPLRPRHHLVRWMYAWTNFGAPAKLPSCYEAVWTACGGIDGCFASRVQC